MSVTLKNGIQPIRVMIVDDSIFMRKALERILSGAGDIEICGSASSGEIALEKLLEARPDVITMDVEMPGMGGLAAVKAIMAKRRTPIIMLSSLTSSGTETSLQALENGAADVIGKPSGGPADVARISTELIEKVRALGRRNASASLRQTLRPVDIGRPVSSAAAAPTPVVDATTAAAAGSAPRSAGASSAFTALKRHNAECIAIGISTGGPAALTQVFAKLDGSIRVPIIVVQHMPAGFTKALADRLNTQCALEVVEAADGMPMEGGKIYIGVAGKQLRVKRTSGRVLISVAESNHESLYTPSADVLFNAVAEVYGRSSVCFIMTGMGNDGTEGLKNIKKQGAYVYGQDEASCVVYGMPRSAALGGLTDSVLPLDVIPQAINAAARGNVM